MSDIEDLQIELDNTLEEIDILNAEIKHLQHSKATLQRVCGFIIGVVITYSIYMLVI
jgi:prefoldin subunit 5